jgi:hypothetical protein
MKLRRLASRLSLALLIWSVSLCARAQAPPAAAPNTAVGHWVAEHPSTGGVGSWWDFRADGTLTLTFGAMVTSPITRTGDTFLSPSGTVAGPPVEIKFKVEGDTLHLTSSGTEIIFARVGPAPSSSDALLGKWKPIPSSTPSSNPNEAALEKAKANAIYVFSADGTQSVRIPFGSREGVWDAQAHTFKFADDPVSYTFLLANSRLILGQPPDNKKIDSYLPDPIQ